MKDAGLTSRIDEVVSVHLEAFPDFFLTQLGPRFLGEYYRCVLAYPLGVLLTMADGGRCVGFVSGFVEPASFYRELRRRRWRLGLAACVGVASRPARLMALVQNYRRAADAAAADPRPRTAELSSLGVRPSASGRGVGSRLVQQFLLEAGRRGADRVVLTTDAGNNDAVNEFYERLGFNRIRTFEARRGRLLNEYCLDIGTSPTSAADPAGPRGEVEHVHTR